MDNYDLIDYIRIAPIGCFSLYKESLPKNAPDRIHIKLCRRRIVWVDRNHCSLIFVFFFYSEQLEPVWWVIFDTQKNSFTELCSSI